MHSHQPTYGDKDMETHQNCGVCSVSGDILRSQEKSPLKSALYGIQTIELESLKKSPKVGENV